MNWGKGITIAMLAFMAFIGSMVYYAFTRNADLVRDDYYENELAFNEIKEEKSNYTNLDEPINIVKNESGVFFTFPSNFKTVKDGEISFYRPDQKKYDRKFELKLDKNNNQNIEYSHFNTGYYDISIHWKDAANKGYIFESSISF